jgi:hypothetical protein
MAEREELGEGERERREGEEDERGRERGLSKVKWRPFFSSHKD